MSFSITLLIVLVTGLISYRAFSDRSLFESVKHYPFQEVKDGSYHRLLTSGFVHGSWAHLMINMYVLMMFGEVVEYHFGDMFGTYGKIIFVLFYLMAIVFADLPSLLRHKDNPTFASIGASGAVSAVVFIYILIYPFQKLSILFLPFISFPAILFGIAYLIYSSWASSNRNDGIDHSAHFAGSVFGILFIAVTKPSILFRFIETVTNYF